MTPKSKQKDQAPPAGVELQDRYLREAFENMREGFQVIGRDWRYLYVNEVAAGHGEKRVEDLLGRSMTEAYPGIDQTAMFKTLEKCMVEKSPATLESEFTYADGHRCWFELRISPLPDGLGILSLDITD
jgi:PAS domain S-box-containing protein